MSAPVLEADGISVRYGACTAVDGASLRLGRGELVGLLGRNGAGKTTLLRVLAGVLQPAAGTVRLDGVPLAVHSRREVARRLAVVPQEPESVLRFRVGEIVLMGRTPHQGPLGFDAPSDVAAAQRAMATAGIAPLADRYPDQLSGGEWQSVRIARALAQEPRCLLCDEPTAHLDLHHRWRLYDLFDRLRRERGCGVLVVSHDLQPLIERADRLLLMAHGRVAAAGPPGTVATPERLAAAFDVPVRAVPGGAAPAFPNAAARGGERSQRPPEPRGVP